MHKFTRELWKAAKPIYASIIEHPFLTGLTDASLLEEQFKFYVIQDALYLTEFARALNIAAARAPNDRWIVTFSEHAKLMLLAERALHKGFFTHWHLSDRDVFSQPMAPTNLAYTSYLLATAYGKSFAELLGALLPCYWIYWEVGKELERRGSRKSLYQRWIDTYASEEYAGICEAVLAIADQIGSRLSTEEKNKMRTCFVTTSRYEYLFWDAAFRLETWPV